MQISNQLVLPIKTYRFYFDTPHNFRLPEYPGSAWRGAFGHALKKTVCVVRNTACNECLLKTACAYTYIFETPPPINSLKMRKYNAAPHPFILRFNDLGYPNNHKYLLDILLFGNGQRYFPYILHAIQTAAHEGIGSQRHKLVLQKVEDIDSPKRVNFCRNDMHNHLKYPVSQNA